MKCTECSKPIKENKEGNNHYCQGHDMFDHYNYQVLARQGNLSNKKIQEKIKLWNELDKYI